MSTHGHTHTHEHNQEHNQDRGHAPTSNHHHQPHTDGQSRNHVQVVHPSALLARHLVPHSNPHGSPQAHPASHHHHSHHHHLSDTSYSHRWSMHITQEEIDLLLIFQGMVPHIFSSPYHYELAIAPALGYGRAKELSQAMVTPLSPISFSYIAPSGEKHIGKVEEKHSHTVYMELQFSPLISGGMVRKEFVETEMPPNGDIP